MSGPIKEWQSHSVCQALSHAADLDMFFGTNHRPSQTERELSFENWIKVLKYHKSSVEGKAAPSWPQSSKVIFKRMDFVVAATILKKSSSRETMNTVTGCEMKKGWAVRSKGSYKFSNYICRPIHLTWNQSLILGHWLYEVIIAIKAAYRSQQCNFAYIFLA